MLLFVSCKNKKKDSGDHLPPKLMQQVLLDINLAEAYSNMVKDSTHKGNTKNLDSLAVYYRDIFAHHKITQQQFDNSMNWYKLHPDDLDTLYSNILPIVNRWQNPSGK
jgi:hypothetical protein